MDFVLSKQILPFLSVGLSCIWLGVLCVLIIYEKKKSALAFVVATFAFLWLLATPSFSNFLLGSLENQYEAVSIAESPASDATVVLGGCVANYKGEVQLTDHSDRVFHAARLYKAKKSRVIIASGGSVRSAPEAYSIRSLLKELGVPGNAIVMDMASLNTHESALNIRATLKNLGLRDVLLVTSAAHMPRAVATFRTAGIKVIPSPCDFRVWCRAKSGMRKFLPDFDSLGGTAFALREYLGSLAYKWRGWINTNK